MKKITFIITYFISLSFCLKNKSIAQNSNINNINSKPIVKEIIEPPVIIKDYKKASDSLLTIAEQNNLNAVKNLEEVKKSKEIFEQQKKEITLVKQEIKDNINLTIKNVIKKLNDVNKSNNSNIITINEKTYLIDSVFKKGNLFRKDKWVYEITFPDGKKRKLE